MMNTTEFVSTREAARMLGLSMTLVQTMLDREEIQGWRTPGGHRRISVQSLMEYKKKHKVNTFAESHALGNPVVMLVSESEALQKGWLQGGHALSCAFEIRWHRTLEAALTDVSRQQPHLLLVDLNKASDVMESILGMLNALQRMGRRLPITLVTDAWPQTPAKDQIPVVRGPLTPQWLEIFLAGAWASQASLLGAKI